LAVENSDSDLRVFQAANGVLPGGVITMKIWDINAQIT
jgi:hypothetical protein